MGVLRCHLAESLDKQSLRLHRALVIEPSRLVVAPIHAHLVAVEGFLPYAFHHLASQLAIPVALENEGQQCLVIKRSVVAVALLGVSIKIVESLLRASGKGTSGIIAPCIEVVEHDRLALAVGVFFKITHPLLVLAICLLVHIGQGAAFHRCDSARHLTRHHSEPLQNILCHIDTAVFATWHPRPASVAALLFLQLVKNLGTLTLQRLLIIKAGYILQLFHLRITRPQPRGLVQQCLLDVLVAHQRAVLHRGRLIISKHSLVRAVFQLRELLGYSLAYRIHIIAVEKVDIRRVAAFLHKRQRLDGQPDGIGRILHGEAHRLCRLRNGKRHRVLLRTLSVHIHRNRLRHRLPVGQQRQWTLLAVAMVRRCSDIFIRRHRATHRDCDPKLHRHRAPCRYNHLSAFCNNRLSRYVK